MKIGKKQAVGIMVSLVVAMAPAFASTGQEPADGNAGMGRLIEANRKIEQAVVTGYKAIENGVVSGYKGIEDSVVRGYKKIEKVFADAFRATVRELQEDKK